MKKNFNMSFTRLFGIIAMIAVIGLAFSCGEDDEGEASPEDQVKIQVTGLEVANGKTAIVGLFKSLSDEAPTAYTTAPKEIGDGSFTCEMRNDIGRWAPLKDDDGIYNIVIAIYADNTMTTVITQGKDSAGGKTIVKALNTFGIGEFSMNPTISSINWGNVTVAPPDDTPTSTEYGTYRGIGASANVTETVVLSTNSFRVSDNSGTGTDYLEFKITDWSNATPTSVLKAAGYTNGFKFTGKMIAQQGYVPSGKTAPNPEKPAPASPFVAGDAKSDESGPECWMFIYFRYTADNDIIFIRSAFSKEGNVNATEAAPKIVTAADGTYRVYKK